MSIFWMSVVVGLVAGYLAKKVRGESPYGLPGDLVVGIIGALLAGWIFRAFGYQEVTGLNVGPIVVALVGAVAFLWGLRAVTRRGPMSAETVAMVKHGIWGLIVGAIITMIIGFAWGGWTTGGSSQRMSEEAVLATRAAICVAQFMKQPTAQEKLKALKEISSWDRATFIEKGGWDKMPGEEKADSTVSRACADGLDVLMRQ